MLHAMRKGAGGWLAKTMLVLLVASFAVWGIGSDMLGSSVGSDVIEVGDQTVTIGEFQREYQNRLNQVAQYFGGRPLTADQARQFGVGQSTVLRLQTTLLETVRSNQLKLGVSDEEVLHEIRNGPSFKNELGQFDRFRFQQVLRQNGYSEAEYVEILRKDIQRRQLIGSFELPVNTTPNILVNTLFNHMGEKRSAEYVELLDSAIGNVPTATDEQLTQFIKDNPGQFTAPEYRKGLYLSLTADAFTDQVTVTDAQLQEEYDNRGSEFDVPESRNILQMIFPDEEAAKSAATSLSGGADFAAVANDTLQLSPTDIDLGEVTKTDLLDELQTPVFGVPLNGVTVPVKTVLGWHLVQVTKIEASKTKTLEDVKEQLSREVALRGASEIMYEKATALQDEFAGGATIDEAGQAIGIKVSEINWIDQAGQNEAGIAVTDLPKEQGFLAELFAKEVEADIDLTETPAGTYYAVSVTDTREAALKKLDTVREAATAAWVANWQHQENQKRADALLEKLKGGASLASLSSEGTSAVSETQALLRSAPSAEMAQDALAKLFELKDNEYASASNVNGDGFILYGLKEIVTADKETGKDMASDIEQQISRSIQQDVLIQYQSHLENEIGVSVKENLIREYF